MKYDIHFSFKFKLVLYVKVCLGHPSKFQRVSRLAFVTAATSLTGGQSNFARCLAGSCLAATLCIHFRVLLLPDGNLPRAKFTLRPKSCVLLYWQRYCTALQQPCQPTLRRGTRNWITELSQRAQLYLYSARQPSRWASAHILVRSY